MNKCINNKKTHDEDKTASSTNVARKIEYPHVKE
jgi:hypothetical protein